MQKRQVVINAIMSGTQIIVISLILFILYRFLLKTIGIEQLGIWSLVLATTSVTQIANLGLSGSVMKFVAKYAARGESKNVSALIQTAVLTVAVFVGLIIIVGYPLVAWLLELVIPNKSLSLAISILPYAFLSLWLMLITSIIQAGLDGYQRIDLRSLLLMGGAAIHLLLCFILAPKYGLIGIAYASVVQNSIVLLSSWIVLRMRAKLLPVFPFKWDKGLFKEIIGYGVNFQIISVASMLYDPTTKVLLSKFGGLSLVGFYEMASRMIQQIRALVVSANHVLVPAIADLQEKTPEKIKDLYLTSYQLLFYVSVPVFALLIISAPAISELWIGSYERFFVVAVIWLSIGWALNTLAAPAYFSNLGIGVLRWNVIAHLAIGVLNAVLGLLLGLLYNGMGVIIGWVVALALGSATIYLSYHIKHDIPFIELCPRASRMIVVTCATSILFARAASYMPDSFNTLMINGAITSLFTIIIFVLLWIHPMRKRMGDWIISDLLGRKRRNQWNQPDIQG